MGRELQKKKNRSSIPKIKLKPKSKKRTNPLGNPIIAANWYAFLSAFLEAFIYLITNQGLIQNPHPKLPPSRPHLTSQFPHRRHRSSGIKNQHIK